MTAALAPDGKYALFELASALPRAMLYTRWETSTNDQDVLRQLFNPAFNPASLVFVADALPGAPSTAATNQADGAVHFVSYMDVEKGASELPLIPPAIC